MSTEQGEHRFIETWERRKAKRAKNKKIADEVNRISPITGRPTKIRALKSGVVIDDAFVRAMRRLYVDQEMSIKRIAIEMGCGTTMVQRIRRENAWALRAPKNLPVREASVETSIKLPKKMLDAVDAYVFGRYRNRSAYFRALIRRDLDLVHSGAKRV